MEQKGIFMIKKPVQKNTTSKTKKKAIPPQSEKTNLPSNEQKQTKFSENKKNDLQRVGASTSQQTGLTDNERLIKIRQMAYFIAANRGFKDGQEIEDWLTAERTIDEQRDSPPIS